MIDYYDENEAENEIDLSLDVDINILNMKYVTVRWWLCVLGKTQTRFEAQFKKKLSSTEAESKRKGYL